VLIYDKNKTSMNLSLFQLNFPAVFLIFLLTRYCPTQNILKINWGQSSLTVSWSLVKRYHLISEFTQTYIDIVIYLMWNTWIIKKSQFSWHVPRHLRRVWKYQRGNQNPYIEEEQTTQWPKEKVQKDKLRSRKHTHKTKDRVTRTLLKTGGEKTYSLNIYIFIL